MNFSKLGKIMKVSAHLDFDMVAVETRDRISLMVDFTAPLKEKEPQDQAKRFKSCWINLVL
jgi:hypothetical protein